MAEKRIHSDPTALPFRDTEHRVCKQMETLANEILQLPQPIAA